MAGKTKVVIEPEGQWFYTKSLAQEKADAMRQRGYRVTIRKYRWGKGRKGPHGKGELGWMASWSKKPKRGRLLR